MVACLQLSIMDKNQLFKYVGRMMCKEQLYINQQIEKERLNIQLASHNRI